MFPILSLIDPIGKILDRVLPDKAANDAAKAQLLAMQASGEMQQVLGQIQVDQAEASSSSLWVSGWRPGVGWCCGAAFAWAFVIQPFLQFLLVAFHSNFDATKLPQLDLPSMLPVLFGMLGLSAMRSYDKQNGSGNGH
jgi:hypothetical protein